MVYQRALTLRFYAAHLPNYGTLSCSYFPFTCPFSSYFLPSKQANFEIRLFYPVFSLLASVLFLFFYIYLYIIGEKSIWMDVWMYKDIKIENSMDIEKDKDKKIKNR